MKSRYFRILIFTIIAIIFILQPQFLRAQNKEMTPEEFVAYNLKKTRERLAQLKEDYRNKYGKDISSQPIDTKTIIDALPKPSTLKIIAKKPKISDSDSDSEYDVKITYISVIIDGKRYSPGCAEIAGVNYFSTVISNFRELHKIYGIPDHEGFIIKIYEKIKKKLPSGKVIVNTNTTVKQVPASEKKMLVAYSMINDGPFIVTQKGIVYPLDVGEARVRMDIGNKWCFYRKITANIYDCELDSAIIDDKASIGIPYYFRIRVQGPADMNKYKIEWEEKDGVKWRTKNAEFIRKGNVWIAENYFTILDSAKKMKGVIIGASVKPKKDDVLGSFEVSTALNIIPFSKIELELAAKGQPPTKEGIDLFFPNYLYDGNRFVPNLVFKDKGGKVIDANEIKDLLKQTTLTLSSESPSVVQVDRGGGQAGLVVGESMITAQLSLKDMKLSSNQVKVTANKLLFTKSKPTGGYTTYTLRIIGPADMSKYQAAFHHKEGSYKSIFIKGSDGSQSASISTVDSIEKIEILKADKVVAMFPVNERSTMPEPSIKLLPIKVPGKIIDTITPVDMGSLTTTSECKKMLKKQYPEYYGTASDDILDSICREMREKEKAEIKEERATQKAQLEILKGLKKEGRQLMVFSDATEIAAVVSGNFDPQKMYCRWFIEKGGSLKMERPQTDIIQVGRDGTCFNKITGFQGDFDTDALATVELIYSSPPIAGGQFVHGGESNNTRILDKKTLEEWVYK